MKDMNESSEKEITELFNSIYNSHTETIHNVISLSLSGSDFVIQKNIPLIQDDRSNNKNRDVYSSANSPDYVFRFDEKDNRKSLVDICIEFIQKFYKSNLGKDLGNGRIRPFSVMLKKLNNNDPKIVLSSTLDIIQIVAPAIAQNYLGLPMMAIVATLVVICRNGIMDYINGNKTQI